MMMNEKKLTFSVQKVLETMKKNVETHKKEFQELLDKNRAHAMKELALCIEEASTGVYPDISKIQKAIHLKPVDHSKDYQRIISMLEITTQSEIDLTVAEFDRYMNDNWDWKESFLSNKTAYGMQ